MVCCVVLGVAALSPSSQARVNPRSAMARASGGACPVSRNPGRARIQERGAGVITPQAMRPPELPAGLVA